MNMKLKVISAVCLSMFAASAFATAAKPVALPCNTTTSANFVNTCVPEATLYIAGSSALGGALSSVVPPDLFDTGSTVPLVTVVDNGSANGNQVVTAPAAGAAAVASSTANKGVTAWYGMSKASLTGGTSKRLFVVYNNTNGSAAGVSQLLIAKPGTPTSAITEADVVTVGPIAGAPNACTVGATANVVNCMTHALTQADMAISDVNTSELYQLYAAATAKLSTLTTTPLALQGMGVAVNNNLYTALQTANLRDGLLPSSCTAGDLTAACQPSVRSADYTSLVTKAGSIKTAAAFLHTPSDTTVLTLARRDNLSGTQASSNIYFADNVCGGMGYDATKGFNYNPFTKALDKTATAILGGGLNIIDGNGAFTNSPATDLDSTANLIVQHNVTSGGVKTALAATSGYAIGVISLNTADNQGTTGWKYVKLDGVSPNVVVDSSGAATFDTNQRAQMISGNYKFAMTSFAVTPVKPVAKSIGVTFTGVIPAVIAGMKDSTLHSLKGIGYLDGGSDVTKASLVHRTAGNNCSPLVM